LIRYLGKQDQIWAKIFCIPKNMHSRTLMVGSVNFLQLRVVFLVGDELDTAWVCKGGI